MIDRAWEHGVDRRVDRVHARSLGFDPDCGGCALERRASKFVQRHRPECLRGREQDRRSAELQAAWARESENRSAGAKRGWEKRRRYGAQ